MAGHDLIVIGASTGGIEALSALLRLLPRTLPAAVLIVQHVHPESPGLLARIFGHAGELPVAYAVDGERIVPGRVWVAPADHHLLVEREVLRVVRGPTENRHRPAIDPLFRSAAAAFGPRVVGVVLTGALDDGTSGLLAIKSRGGLAVVQEPDEALAASMPQSAIDYVAIDHRVRLAEMGPLLIRLAEQPAGAEPTPPSDDLVSEVEAARFAGSQRSAVLVHSPRSPFSCPDCGGALWEVTEDDLFRFRCHIGHAYTAESLALFQDRGAEHALLVALRTFAEQGHLFERISTRASSRGHDAVAAQFQLRSEHRQHDARAIRELLGSFRVIDATHVNDR